ncbi:MAG: 50S ribosomal protein L15 [Candidatus Nanohaloarchaeota archaeon QJJ-9]|nr:50S ribosomal protein L15 [Candidatus Nanohaloarchaeota archaeon QJJ-9]
MSKKGRGSNTHGHGTSKKRRHAGNRGGRGEAGKGKKAKHKKQIGLAEDVLGSDKGFNRPKSIVEEEKAINLLEIDQNIEEFVEEGAAEEESGKFVFDAEEAGFDKVLGKGQLRNDIDVKAPDFSGKAEEKIEESGNEAIEV